MTLPGSGDQLSERDLVDAVLRDLSEAAERWEAFRSVWAVGALGIPLPAEAEPALTPLERSAILRASLHLAPGAPLIMNTFTQVILYTADDGRAPESCCHLP